MITLSAQGIAAMAPTSTPTPSITYQAAPVVATPFGPGNTDPLKIANAPAAPSDGPSTVSIPSVGIHTKYEPKGLLPGKVLDMPAVKAAWYNESALITATQGSTVIAGHVNTNAGGKGPLGGLADLHEGAAVTVTGPDGTPHAFKIVALSTVEKSKLDPAWFTRSGPRQLVLITCGGQVEGYNKYGLPEFTHNTVAIALPAA